MTNKTEMVSVPRELFEAIAYFDRGHRTVGELQLWAKDALMRHDNPILAAPPEDVRAVVDEPVGYASAGMVDQLIRGGVSYVCVFSSRVHLTNVPLYMGPQRRLEMADVVKAHMEIPHCPVLTSNQCHALAMKLNETLNK